MAKKKLDISSILVGVLVGGTFATGAYYVLSPSTTCTKLDSKVFDNMKAIQFNLAEAKKLGRYSGTTDSFSIMARLQGLMPTDIERLKNISFNIKEGKETSQDSLNYLVGALNA